MNKFPENGKVAIRLTFTGGGYSIREFEAKEEFPGPRNATGEERFWTHLVQELRRELSFGKFYDELPDISDLMDGSEGQSFPMEDFDIERYFDWRNTYHAWTEIHNLLISTKYNLVESRVYKALEGVPGESDNHLSNSLSPAHQKDGLLQTGDIQHGTDRGFAISFDIRESWRFARDRGFREARLAETHHMEKYAGRADKAEAEQ